MMDAYFSNWKRLVYLNPGINKPEEREDTKLGRGWGYLR